MFKENAEPVMWWYIEGRNYMEFDDGRILTSDDGIVWSGRNSITNKNLAEEGEKMQKTFDYEVKALLIAYQKLNAKYLTIVKKRVCKICTFLKRIIAVLKREKEEGVKEDV